MGRKCERCAFFTDCGGFGRDIGVCHGDADVDTDECYEPSDEALREDLEAQAVDDADAKRKGEW